MSRILDEIIFGTDSPSEEERYSYLQMKAFWIMQDYLNQRGVCRTNELADTVLEGEDLRKEVTIMHENICKDMDKFFEIAGKQIPDELIKIREMNEGVDITLNIIKKIRAEKRANA